MEKGKSNKKLIIILIIFTLLLIVYLLYNNFFHSEIRFNIKEKNIEIKIGESIPIEYEANGNYNIIWKSENNSIVIVNDGIVTGMGVGKSLITGKIIKDGKETNSTCYVSSYMGNKNITLNEVIIPEGELYITKGKSYEIPIGYSPENSYVNKIEYQIENNDVVTYDGKINGNDIGVTNVNVIVNGIITKTIRVHVIEKEIETMFYLGINEVNIEDNIILKPKETKKIEYTIEPKEAFVESIKWESSNKEIVEIEEGILKANSSGNAIVKLTINDIITKEIKVVVSIPVTGISIESNPKLAMKVGEKEVIKTNILPTDATNKKVKYINSNPSAVIVNEKGEITAVGRGSGTITVRAEDGNYQSSVSYNVNPKTGLINNDGGIWGYTSANEKIPERADINFFRKLASEGKGTLSGETYLYNDNGKVYKYNISTSTLSSGSVSALTRIYYPPGVDLSRVNTFTFGNGTGSAGFVGILKAIDDDRSNIKSSGIIILIATKTGRSYNSDEFILATEFVKSIVDQKTGVKNAIGAYSGSGEEVGKAANKSNYDRVIMYSSRFNANITTTLRDKEIIVYEPKGDQTMRNATMTTLNNLANYNYSNVTVISNDSGITGNSKYTSKFLVINPGNKMGSGHVYRNIPPTKLFSYACR